MVHLWQMANSLDCDQCKYKHILFFIPFTPQRNCTSNEKYDASREMSKTFFLVLKEFQVDISFFQIAQKFGEIKTKEFSAPMAIALSSILFTIIKIELKEQKYNTYTKIYISR